MIIELLQKEVEKDCAIQYRCNTTTAFGNLLAHSRCFYAKI